jgi:hypothetical protein
MKKNKVMVEMKTTLDAAVAGEQVAKRYDIVLKDSSLASGTHTVYLDNGLCVTFRDGKANVLAETKSKLEDMGLI